MREDVVEWGGNMIWGECNIDYPRDLCEYMKKMRDIEDSSE